MKELIICGRSVKVDDEDVGLIKNKKWFMTQGGYLYTRHPPSKCYDGKAKNFTMARYIMIFYNALNPDMALKYINGDIYDNRKENLCYVTFEELAKIKKKKYSRITINKREPKYIYFSKNRYQVLVKPKATGKLTYFGQYKTLSEAEQRLKQLKKQGII